MGDQSLQVSAMAPVRSEIGKRIRNEVSALVPLIRKNALEGEKLGRVPDETVQALQKTGLFLVSVPIEHGGYALGARDLAEIIMEVARGDGGTGWITMIASGHTRIALTLPDRAVAEIYRNAAHWPGPTLAGGSLFSEKIQPAEEVEGGILVRAGCRWMFASGSAHAGFAAVGVDLQHEDGERRRGMVLLERGQYEILDDWHVMGMRASSSNGLTVTQDVFVPDYRFLDMSEFPNRLASFRSRFAGLGYKSDPLGLMMVVALEMISIAVGMAKAGLESFIEQAKIRKPFNLPYATIAESAVTQTSAAKAAAKIRAAETMVLKIADKIDCYALTGQSFTPLEESEGIMDLVFGGNLAGEALDMLQYALGSSSIGDFNPIQRYVRDIRVALTHGSLRYEPVAEINGRQMLGFPPFQSFAGGLPGVTSKVTAEN